MSTLSEIEAAVETLPRPQQEELFAFLAERIGRAPEASGGPEDPFENIVGAFAGPKAATGRRAEEILYGTGRFLLHAAAVAGAGDFDIWSKHATAPIPERGPA